MKIAFFLQGKSYTDHSVHVSAVTEEIIGRLNSKGALVDILVPEEKALNVNEIRLQYDLYILKSKTPLTLSLAGALSASGASMLNTWKATLLNRNKVISTALLAASSLPVPPSWATGQPLQFLPLLKEGPLWIKPVNGSRGKGVCRITNDAEVTNQKSPADPYGLPLPLFAQKEAPSEGRDLKVYVVGDKTWAITRPWPARSMEDKLGEPAVISQEVRSTALACGKALGLEIYGVDFLISGDQFYVVDINAFPGFKGASGTPFYIADYIYRAACYSSSKNQIGGVRHEQFK